MVKYKFQNTIFFIQESCNNATNILLFKANMFIPIGQEWYLTVTVQSLSYSSYIFISFQTLWLSITNDTLCQGSANTEVRQGNWTWCIYSQAGTAMRQLQSTGTQHRWKTRFSETDQIWFKTHNTDKACRHQCTCTCPINVSCIDRPVAQPLVCTGNGRNKHKWNQ